MKNFRKAIVVCFFISCTVSFIFTGLGQAEQDKVLLTVNMANTITGVAKNDLKLAVMVLLRKVQKEELPEYRLENNILADTDSVVQNFNMGKIDVLSISAIDYLKIRDLVDMEPAFVTLRDGKPVNDYVLLVNMNKDIKTIEQLQNKKIAIEKGMNGEVAVLWLETILLERSLPESSVFIQKFKLVDKASQAVLPVFFGQADACIVNRYKFETMSALNPQVGKKLQVIYESPSLLTMLTCFRKGLDEKIKEAVLNYVERLRSYPEGQQFLIIFHSEGITKYKNEYITTIENLYEKFKTLKTNQGEKE